MLKHYYTLLLNTGKYSYFHCTMISIRANLRTIIVLSGQSSYYDSTMINEGECIWRLLSRSEAIEGVVLDDRLGYGLGLGLGLGVRGLPGTMSMS